MTLTETNSSTPPAEQRGPQAWKRWALLGGLVAFGAFWTWALFFASEEAVNRIGDRGWAERAERICAATTSEREALADYTRIDEPTPELIARRADIVDAATDLVESMLADITAVAPTDAKGADLVPRWAADYRTYIADRRAYADELRASTENLPFYETAVDGIPLSDKIAVFAGDNEMASCAPPLDLS